LLTETISRSFRVTACVGFVLSGMMNMSECSDNGYIPRIGYIGWQIAALKTLGTIGFLVGSIMGLSSQAKQKGPIASPVNALWGAQHVEDGTVHGYAADCPTGSCFFLVASLLMLYEQANHFSVRVRRNSGRRWLEWIRRAT